jgi:hypothetical protein
MGRYSDYINFLNNGWDVIIFIAPPVELEDLEGPLGPQPFVWPEEPIIDEADNSDMTPQCMPVIDPNFVRESFIEDCLLGKWEAFLFLVSVRKESIDMPGTYTSEYIKNIL